VAPHTGEMDTLPAAFRKEHGIPPGGDETAPASAWGFPLPPASHPLAVACAKSVLRNESKNTRYPDDAVARHVARAKRILRGKRKEAITSFAQLLSPRSAAVARRAHESAAPAADAHEIAFQDTTRLELREADASGAIPGVLLIRSGPGNLGDRHYYTDTCLAEAASSGVFEGAKSHVDHPTPTEDREQPGRSVRSLAGYFSNAEAQPYKDPQLGDVVGLFATFHPQQGRDDVVALVRTCVEYRNRFPTKQYVGLSISATGSGSADEIEGETWNRVDSITSVESVDIVTQAGAGGAFVPLRESLHMAEQAKKFVNGDGAVLTLEADSLEKNVAQPLRESAKAAAVLVLEEATGKKITPEQNASLDKHMGNVSGGKMASMLDGMTEDANDEDIESQEGADELDEAKGDDEEMMSDVSGEKGKSPKLYAKLLAARKKTENAVKEAAEQKRIAESATGKVSAAKHRELVEDVLTEGNYPAEFQPFLRRTLLNSGAKSKVELREAAAELKPLMKAPADDGDGVFAMREGVRHDMPGVIDLSKVSFIGGK